MPVAWVFGYATKGGKLLSLSRARGAWGEKNQARLRAEELPERTTTRRMSTEMSTYLLAIEAFMCRVEGQHFKGY